MKVHDALNRGRTTAGGRDYPVPGGMIETAENLRRQYDISREEQDELAVRSHQRAVAAQKDGLLADQIIPVTVTSRAGDEVIDTDEHPRADTSVESLSKLKPILGKQDPESTVTAGNASGQNDAAVDVHRDHPGEGRRAGADARWCGWCPGVSPACRPTSWASARCLRRSSRWPRRALTLADIDLIELNEAFAAQALAVMREWKFTPADLERTNVHGSGISLGHPVGATGGRMLATLAREMHRRDGTLRPGDHVHRRRPGAGGGVREGEPHDQTRADGWAHRRSGRDRRDGTAVRGQGGHPERPANSSTPMNTRRRSSTRCRRWGCSGS